MAQVALYIGNSTTLSLFGLIPSGTGAGYTNDATVQATLTDSTGSEVTGESWPVTMEYVTGSNGVYQVVLSSDLEIEEGEVYDVTVTATSDDGDGQWVQSARAQTRD